MNLHFYRLYISLRALGIIQFAEFSYDFRVTISLLPKRKLNLTGREVKKGSLQAKHHPWKRFFSVLAVHILMEQEEGANEIPAERILNQDAPSLARFFFSLSRNHAGIKLNGIPDY